MSYNTKKIKEEISNGKEIIRYNDYRLLDNCVEPSSNEQNATVREMFTFLDDCLEFEIDEKKIEKNGDKIKWDILIGLPQFPEKFSHEFIEKFSHDIPWETIPYYKNVKPEFLVKYKKYINWNKSLFSPVSFTEEQIRELEPLIDNLTEIVHYSDSVSEEFLLEFKEKISWERYWYFFKRSVEFNKKFIQYINWKDFINYALITEEILDAFGEFLNWNTIFDKYYLSNRLLAKYSNNIISFHMKSIEKTLSIIMETDSEEPGIIPPNEPEMAMAPLMR